MFSKVHLAGGQEWIGGAGDEAGERSARLQSYCELLGRKWFMLERFVRVGISVGCLESLSKDE